MRHFKKGILLLTNVIAVLMLCIMASCEKETFEPEWPNPDDTEQPSNPEGSENDRNPETDGYIVGELRYKISTVSTDECHVAGMSVQGVVNHLIIPNEVIIEGKSYRVTEIEREAKISALSVVTSDNLKVINSHSFTSDLQQLIVGANVKKVSPDAWNYEPGPYRAGYISFGNGQRISYRILSNEAKSKVSKVIWLPNTPPRGLSFELGGKENYTSVNYELVDHVTQISELSSLFWVDGILYALKNPAERTCVAIGCDYSNNESLSLKSEVTNRGISFRIMEYGNYAFANNLKIKHISTGEITEINDGSFMYCSNIQSIDLGEDLERIGDHAFYDCALIQKLEIGPKVTKIEEKAFSGCSAVEEFIVHANEQIEELKVYDHPLFTHDSRLRSITLSRNVCSAWSGDSSSNLFESAVNLRKVTMIGKCTIVYDREFKNCTNLIDVQLGDNVTIIGKFAFSGCSAMESFIVGKSITKLNENAFSDCTGLKNFTTEAVTPPECGSQALQDIDKWKCTLHVPDESVDLYKTASQWKNFLFIE